MYIIKIMSLKNTNIIEKLKLINYPGFSRDIVSFGMIKDINISDDTINIVLSQSTSNEDVLNQIKKDIINKISSISDNHSVEVTYHKSDQFKKEASSIKRTRDIKNIIAVASGKGGVGKSTVAINLAAELSKSYKVGLLDLDIYGPSIPTLIGEDRVPEVRGNNLLIPIEKFGMKFMSFGFLNSNNDPAIWRGPMVSKLTHQFFDNVDWGELDYLILDLPPGTGDIQLTLVQKIALSGAVIVTTPQDLAHKDVQKGTDMFNKVNTPVLGIIENMSFFNISGKIINYNDNTQIALNGIEKEIEINQDGTFSSSLKIFQGKSALNESQRLNIPLLGNIPLDPNLSLLSDLGKPCVFEDSHNNRMKKVFFEITNKITKIISKQSVISDVNN
ncbi:MAG: chromosome partitioning protein [Candidatus Marinimicrobia bacterium]|nr:chromosome partitioning protein [Candidatus Neomarinimicrobiota bacterium]